MDKHIISFLEDIVGYEEIQEYEFEKLYGFTFVFKKAIFTINDKISAAEIKPVGIIFEENGEYYLAPIDVIDEIEQVVKEFVEKEII